MHNILQPASHPTVALNFGDVKALCSALHPCFAREAIFSSDMKDDQPSMYVLCQEKTWQQILGRTTRHFAILLGYSMSSCVLHEKNIFPYSHHASLHLLHPPRNKRVHALHHAPSPVQYTKSTKLAQHLNSEPTRDKKKKAQPINMSCEPPQWASTRLWLLQKDHISRTLP
jgi:hypothetical protein